jgi:hypothetical protein
MPKGLLVFYPVTPALRQGLEHKKKQWALALTYSEGMLITVFKSFVL